MIQRFLLLRVEGADGVVNQHLEDGWRVVPGTVCLNTIEYLKVWEGPDLALRDVSGRCVEGWVAVTLQRDERMMPRDHKAAWADAGELLESLAEQGWELRLTARSGDHWHFEIWRGDERLGQAGENWPEAVRNLVDTMHRQNATRG